MNKPTIPNEVADAIEYLRNGAVFAPAYTNEDIVSGVFDPSVSSSPFVTLRTIPFDTLMAALINGYEREMTEGEALDKVAKEYHRSKGTAYSYGIRYTLDTLGINIEGVNA